MHELLKQRGCKEDEIISKIEAGFLNGICDFVKSDDPIELKSFNFVNYIKSKDKVKVIFIATHKYCFYCKNNGVPISSKEKVTTVLSGLKGISIKEHIDYLNEERRERAEISPVPGKEELRKLFARAITCLGFIIKCF